MRALLLAALAALAAAAPWDADASDPDALPFALSGSDLVIVVTGATRGIGLELARQLGDSAAVDAVYATFRGEACPAGLQAVADAPGSRVRPLAMDVTDDASIAAAAAEVQREAGRVDWLVNNAGTAGDTYTHPRETTETAAREMALHVLNVNAVSPLMVTQAFLPLLAAAAQPKVCFVSSIMGSMAFNGGSVPSYRASKAALNSVAVNFAEEHPNLLVVAMHPGWVKTDLTREDPAPLTPRQSVGGMLQVMEGLSAATSGRFMGWDGEELPW